jgi:hypothetical protein
MVLVSDNASFTVERHADGVYRILEAGRFIGYVERVGRVYVALRGATYPQACEVGQALSLSAAAATLSARSSAVRSDMPPAA